MKILFFALLMTTLPAFANTPMGSTGSSIVTFEKGMASLKADAMEQIKKTIEEAKATGPIREIKVVSWADQEYPASGEKASKESIKLAEARNDSVKRYLKTLKVGSVRSYNMARRPNALQELFHTSQAKVKDKMEATGEAPKQNDTGLFGINAKASDSLILVYTKGNPNPL
jgi:CHAD domain-containing protein